MKKIVLSALVLIVAYTATAQQIQIDRGIRVAGLWCFPLLENPNAYLYLPSTGRLATKENGDPEFSMIRYVDNSASDSSNQTITQASGGAVLHFLITYETPEDQVSEAERLLRTELDNEDVHLKGPVIFTKGRYHLISSILNGEGERQPRLLAGGSAPVLEGSRLALSFPLSPEKSKLLLESFRMQTSDISISFEMEFDGLTDAFQAKMTVNWSDIQKAQGYKAGGSVYFVKAEVEAQIEEHLKNNAIELTTLGSDDNMESLINRVYEKIVEMLYNPVVPSAVPQSGGLGDAISSLLSGLQGEDNPSGFGLGVGYQYKNIQARGKSVMDFNSRANVARNHFITFNIGSLYQRYGDDPRFFKTVNLDDPDFKQREIYVSVDGEMLKEFDKMLNSVSVMLVKGHQSEDTTIRELLLRRETLEDNHQLKMVYGSRKDHDRSQWLNYKYKTIWQFQGGKDDYITDWKTQSAAMINLYVPYQRRNIALSGDLQHLASQGIRAVIVDITYPFFEKKRSIRKVVRTSDEAVETHVEVTMPLEEYAYEYQLTWVGSDGQRLTSSGQDDLGILFIDELPANP